MSISVMNWVWDHSRSRHGARLVLLAIADNSKAPGSWAWPSNPELVRKTMLGERAVQSAIPELVKLGELEVRYQEGPKGCNLYRVIMRAAGTPQNPHPADIAGVQILRGEASGQVNPQDPAESAPPEPPAESAPPPQISTPDPAESAPGTVKEPKPHIQQRRAGKPRREDTERLCAHLADRIESNGSKRPAITQRWRDTARLMIDRDALTEEQIHRAIDWCQDDEFWRLNVRSMPKLREHYDRLRQEAQRKARAGSNGQRLSHGDQAYEQAQALKAQLRGEAAP